jgi:porin
VRDILGAYLRIILLAEALQIGALLALTPHASAWAAEQEADAAPAQWSADAPQRLLEMRERLRVAILKVEHELREREELQQRRDLLVQTLRRQMQALGQGAKQPFPSLESTPAIPQQLDPHGDIIQDSSASGSDNASAPANQDEAGFGQRDLLLGDPGGIRSRLQQSGITIDLQDSNQAIGNLTGGIRRGVRYSGATELGITVDLDKAVGWTGGTFFTSVKWFRGRSATVDLVGSLQQVSYTEIGRSGLRDIWLEQTFANGMVSLRAGQERVDEEFLHTRFGEVLVNSTFSWPGLMNVNLAFGDPTEFLSMPVARVAVQPTDDFRVLGAVFKGTTRELRGTLAIGEAQYFVNHPFGVDLPGTYRVGVVHQNGSFADQFFPDWMHHNTSSAYIGMDQMIWRKRDTEGQEIGIFARAMVADRHSLTDLYLDGGFNWKGAIASRPDDVFGFGVAYLRETKPRHYSQLRR